MGTTLFDEWKKCGEVKGRFKSEASRNATRHGIVLCHPWSQVLSADKNLNSNCVFFSFFPFSFVCYDFSLLKNFHLTSSGLRVSPPLASMRYLSVLCCDWKVAESHWKWWWLNASTVNMFTRVVNSFCYRNRQLICIRTCGNSCRQGRKCLSTLTMMALLVYEIRKENMRCWLNHRKTIIQTYGIRAIRWRWDRIWIIKVLALVHRSDHHWGMCVCCWSRLDDEVDADQMTCSAHCG